MHYTRAGTGNWHLCIQALSDAWPLCYALCDALCKPLCAELCHVLCDAPVMYFLMHFVMYCLMHFVMYCVIHLVMYCVTHYVTLCNLDSDTALGMGHQQDVLNCIEP